jgi:hypothetical protein
MPIAKPRGGNGDAIHTNAGGLRNTSLRHPVLALAEGTKKD